MTRTFLLTAAVLGFLGVALGAFGTHALAALLAANGRADTFDTASRYHLLHAVVLIGIAWAASQANTDPQRRLIRWSGWLLTAGTIIFAGSLYLLAILNLGWFGAIAPIGGALLLAGWACLGVFAWRL
ncbi:MAG: DUF423 domain-containing protein [Anaerolineae bacterium]|nr:DUF423 domain-containing protein [Anaerolineae bacterium]